MALMVRTAPVAKGFNPIVLMQFPFDTYCTDGSASGGALSIYKVTYEVGMTCLAIPYGDRTAAGHQF